MFRNHLNLKSSYSRSLSIRHHCIFPKKSPLTSAQCSFTISKRSLSKCLQDRKYLYCLLKNAKTCKFDSFERNISTSSFLYQESKHPNDKRKPEIRWKMVVLCFILSYIINKLFEIFKPLARRGEASRRPEGLPSVEISWEEFKYEMLAKGEVAKLIISKQYDNYVVVVLRRGAVYKNRRSPYIFYFLGTTDLEKFELKLRETERQLGIAPEDSIPIDYEGGNMGKVVMYTLIFLFTYIIYRKIANAKLPNLSSLMGPLTKANFTLIDPLSGQGKGVKFADVAGLKEAKIEIMEFVDYLKRPEHYRNLGAKVPKGALLLGPPGCGKTLLAKAVATESNVPFLSMNGSEFIEMIGGLGAARVRDLFKEAKKRIPCIVYIDEIDAIGKKRSLDPTDRGGGEEEQTLNQLLVEMDGMVSNEGVILLASTNRADVLDSALLRPGRFDRQILIDLPTLEERRQIFEQYLKTIHLEHQPSYYSKRLASLTPGFSGADIANVCNEAALYAARYKKNIVGGEDLEYAVERVVGGTEKRTSAISPEEKQLLAYHEAGKALVGWIYQYGDALLKVSIVPRTGSPAGWTQFSQSDKFLYSKEELLGKMCMALGGRVAVSLTFNKITTAGENDLKKVTKMAYAQIRRFGMNEKIGLLSFNPEETVGARKKPYSKHLGALFDQEARNLITSVYKETETILLENKDKLFKLAEELLKRETLNYDDVVKLIGHPPHQGKKVIEPFVFDLSLEQAAGPQPTGETFETKKEENGN